MDPNHCKTWIASLIKAKEKSLSGNRYALWNKLARLHGQFDLLLLILDLLVDCAW